MTTRWSSECSANTACEETPDLLPGEESLHETLQAELIQALADHHRALGQVVHLEARLDGPGTLHGYVRSIEAGSERYSCEIIELHTLSGEVLNLEFFALVPPLEEASEASVLTLAKATTISKSRAAKPIEQTTFDAIATTVP